MRVSIIGQGYVGLSLAIALERSGHDVLGFDINTDIIKNLKDKISHVETVSNEQLENAIHYNATCEPKDICNSEVVILAVPTPIDEGKLPDLEYLRNACEIAATNLKSDSLIINESTSFPGTLRNLVLPIFAKYSELNHIFASSPERVDPGNAIWNHSNTPRLIAGLTPEATEKAFNFYSSFCANLIVVESPEIAEAAKLFENTFRHVNIGLVNEFAQICHSLNLNVADVLDASSTKPFGFMRFNPSIGVGGHCIPVDPHYLKMSAGLVNADTRFIDLATTVNDGMPIYVTKRIIDDLGNLEGKTILVHGIAYKHNVSDTRESPSLRLIENLNKHGANVFWQDELVNDVVIPNRRTADLNYFDCTIITLLHDNDNINNILKTSEYVFDCSGKVKNLPSI